MLKMQRTIGIVIDLSERVREIRIEFTYGRTHVCACGTHANARFVTCAEATALREPSAGFRTSRLNAADMSIREAGLAQSRKIEITIHSNCCEREVMGRTRQSAREIMKATRKTNVRLRRNEHREPKTVAASVFTPTTLTST